MKKLLFVFLLTFTCLAYAQENYLPYYEWVLQAREASKQNRYKKSDSLYTLAINTVSLPHPHDFIGASLSACKIGELEKAKKYLFRLTETGYSVKMFKKHKSTFKPYIKGKAWRNLLKQYQKNYKVYYDNLNKDLVATINEMYENDQKYRGWNYSKKIDDINRIDSENLAKIKLMQKQYGKIPGIREVGYDGMMLLYIIFRHVDDSYTLDTLGQQIIEQSKHGDFLPYMGPAIIDYKAFMQVSSKKYHMTCQIYGTQIMRTPKTKTSVIIPVKDYENINALRRSVGLGKLHVSDTIIYDEHLVKEECGEAFEFCD